MLKKNHQFLYSTECVAIRDDYLFFFDITHNSFCKYDLKNNECTAEIQIEGLDYYKYRMFSKIILLQNDAFLIPCSENSIIKINLETFEQKPIQLNINIEKMENYLEDVKFLDALLYKDSIYLIPTTYPALVEYNFVKDETYYYHNVVQLAFDNQKVIDEKAFFRKACINDGQIVLPSCMGDCVIFFDLVTKACHATILSDEEVGLSSACVYNTSVVLAPRESTIVKVIDKHGNIIKKIDFSRFVKEYSASDILLFEGGRICLVPYRYNNPFIWFFIEEEEIELSYMTDDIDGLITPIINGKEYIFHSVQNAENYIYNKQKNTFDKIAPFICNTMTNRRESMEYYLQNRETEKIFREYDADCLEEYIKLIRQIV